MEQFDLGNHEYIELCNLLKATGLCDSGAAAKQAVSNGHVKVDDEIEYRKRRKLRQGQLIEYGDCTIKIVCS